MSIEGMDNNRPLISHYLWLKLSLLTTRRNTMKLALVKSNGHIVRWGFKSKNQLPLFMIWVEEWRNGEVAFAWVLFNSKQYIGV